MTDIQSPVPGMFYHRSSPGATPFKAAGNNVAVDVIS